MEQTPSPIRLMIVDDHLVTRLGAVMMLNGYPDMIVVGEASNGRDAISQYAVLRPDVTLMDLRMPDLDGIQAIREILRADRDARILVMTVFEGDADIERALKAGARGYLFKDILPDELIKAVRTVHRGEEYLTWTALKKLRDSRQYEALSPRELDVLRLLGTGGGNREIAHRLRLSEFTVKNHVRNILAKLGVEDRTAAVALALERGLLRPGGE